MKRFFMYRANGLRRVRPLLELLEGRQLLAASVGSAPPGDFTINSPLTASLGADPSDPTMPTSPNEVKFDYDLTVLNPIYPVGSNGPITVSWGDGTEENLPQTAEGSSSWGAKDDTSYVESDFNGDWVMTVNGQHQEYDASAASQATHYPYGIVSFESGFDLHGDHAYAEPGDYTISVTITDVLGNTSTQTTQVHVGPTIALTGMEYTDDGADVQVDYTETGNTQGASASIQLELSDQDKPSVGDSNQIQTPLSVAVPPAAQGSVTIPITSLGSLATSASKFLNAVIDNASLFQVANADESVPFSNGQIAWGAWVSPAFKDKIISVSHSLNVDPSDLMSAIAVESNYTFSPSVKNPNGAVGLIQFTKPAIKDMKRVYKSDTKLSKDALAKMSALQQLDYVQQDLALHLDPSEHHDLGDIYMAIFCPKGIGMPDSTVLYAKTDKPQVKILDHVEKLSKGVTGPPKPVYVVMNKNYWANKSVDTNGDGKITRGEAAQRVYDARVTGLEDGNRG